MTTTTTTTTTAAAPIAEIASPAFKAEPLPACARLRAERAVVHMAVPYADGHAYDESAAPGTGGGGSVYPGILTITSNDNIAPTTTIPLEGVEPSHVALATRAGDRGRLVAAFRKFAHAHLTGPV